MLGLRQLRFKSPIVKSVYAVLVAILMSSLLQMGGPNWPTLNSTLHHGESIQSPNAVQPIDPNDRGPGMGKWVWPATSKDKAVRFRKEFVLKGAIKQVRAWIAADVRYRLWVNGVLASRGPADVGRDYDSPPCGPWFEDVRDFTHLVRPGKNVIAVEVLPFSVVSSEWPLGHPGLKLDLDIKTTKGNAAIGTDPSWKCAIAEDLDQSGAKNGYRLTMANEPIGWKSTKFEDTSWEPASVTDNQLPTLVSELPPPLEVELRPTSVTRVSSGVIANVHTGGAKIRANGGYSLCYGHILAGYVGLTVTGHAGARLLISPNEHNAPGHNRQAEIMLREGKQTLDLPYFDSFSVINIQALDISEPIEIEEVRCLFTSYPVQYKGSFASSQPNLNRIWEVCRWCTQICMQTHHLDSPHHQEPVSDAGDYLIESLNGFYCFGDGTLIRQDLKKIARNLEQRNLQSFHTSYSLMWLQMLLQYYDYTGDAKTVLELAPTAFHLIDRFKGYIGKNGLISEAPNYMFMDWVEIEGFTAHHPPAVIGQGYMTALFYRALADGIRVAKMVHNDDRAEGYAILRGKISEAFDRELWVPDKSLYRDGKPFVTTVKPNQWLPADKDIETFTTQGNTFAVACGLAIGERAKTVMTNVMARPDLHCQPYFMHFVFQALDAAGLFDKFAVSQINRWHIQPDTQSFLEMWDTGDLSHAWIGSPLYQMSGVILGVRPVQPGFKRFQIAPQSSGLKWAKGTVPTPHGPIAVEWHLGRKLVQLQFTVPIGTIGIVDGREYTEGSYTVQISTGG